MPDRSQLLSEHSGLPGYNGVVLPSGNCVLAAVVKRGGFIDIRQAAAANATGRGWCGRTVIAINTPAMPITDDAT